MYFVSQFLAYIISIITYVLLKHVKYKRKFYVF